MMPAKALRVLFLSLGLLALTETASAACTSPVGNAGDQIYASNYGSMAFCNGTNWMSMAGGVSVTVNTSGGGATPAGSSDDVQYNSAGALAADTGTFTYASGLLKAPTVSATSLYGQYASVTTIYNPGSFSGNTISANSFSSTAISATNISGTLIQAGTSTATCAAAIKGSIRYNNTSNTIQVCTGTVWTSLSSSSIPNVIGYGAYDGSTATCYNCSGVTVVKATTGKYNVSLTTAQADAYYPISLAVTAPGNARFINYTNTAATGFSVWVRDTAGTFVDLSWTVVVGVGGGNSGGGGSATPAGSTGDIQFNSAGALAADTGQLFWDATNNRLGIGTGAPSYPLEVNGYAAATNFYQSSDRRLKDHIVPIEAGLSVVERLRPVSFRWKKDGRDAVGLIAQDIVKVIPTAVTSNTEGMYSVDYTQATPYLIRSVQELNAAYRELSTINLKLGDENDDLRESNRRLEERLLRVEQLLQRNGRNPANKARVHQ